MREMKDSGIEWIGEIPKHWTTSYCKYISTFVNGYAFKGEDLIDDYIYPVIRIGDINNGNIVYSDCLGVSLNIGLDAYRIRKNDILIAMSGATVGKTGIVTDSREAYINQRVGIFRSTDFQFLFYCLSTRGFLEEINLKAFGSAQPNVSERTCMNFKIPFPEKKERDKICYFLNKKCAEIDSLSADIQKEIETLQEYRKSVITEAVSKGLDPDVEMKDSLNPYVGQINAEWNEKKTKYSFRIRKDIAGYEGPTVLSITQKGIRPKSLKNGEGQQAENYSNYQHVSIGNYAMNHMDLLTGWIDISKYEGVTSPDYRVFILTDETDCIPEYYLYFFQMCYFNKIFYKLGRGVSGFGRWRLPAEQFLNFVIPKPSKKEQKDIASFLDSKCSEIDSIIANKQKQLETLAEYRKSLIYEYVTGKKEVPTT